MSFVDRIGNFFDLFTENRVLSTLVVLLYAAVFYYVIQFAMSIPYYTETSCTLDVLKFLVEEGTDPIKASDVACTVVDVHGGITSHVSAVIGVVVGLAASVFSLRWSNVKDPK